MELTPELVVRAYCGGAFPMADRHDGEVGWYQPDPRTILPLVLEQPGGRGGPGGGPAFHIPRSLRKAMRRNPMSLTFDQDFEAVIEACAQPVPGREETWISRPIVDVFLKLHRLGLAHSIEAWRGGELVGGIYGLALNAAFFGESMFSRRSNASKICLVGLVDHLIRRGFTLFDVQLTNPHLQQFGIIELPHEQYMCKLDAALARDEVSW